MALILVIDDSPTEIHVLSKMLENNGYQVASAANGQDGIAKAKEIKPDLILMDVVMPDLNGFQATRQLSKDPETASIPVFIVSTKSQETDKVWGKKQGAREYLTKPVSENELIEKIKSELGK